MADRMIAIDVKRDSLVDLHIYQRRCHTKKTVSVYDLPK